MNSNHKKLGRTVIKYLLAGISLSLTISATAATATNKKSNELNVTAAKPTAAAALPTPTPKTLPKPPQHATTIQLDRIVAIANNEIITQQQFDQHYATAKRQLQMSNTPQPPEKSLKKQVLKFLIDQSLQLQLAKRGGLSISDQELNQAVEKIAKRNKSTLSGLKLALSARGINYAQFREQIRNQLLVSKIQQSAVSNQVTVSPQEIADMKQRLAKKQPAQYHLADLLIPLPDSPTTADITKAENEAEKISKQIKSGASFKKLAAEHSSADNAMQGGDMGWRSSASLPALFLDAISGKPNNSVVGPLHAPNGFHLLKLLGKKSQVSKFSDDQIGNMIRQRKFEENIAIWMQQLHSTAYIKIEP